MQVDVHPSAESDLRGLARSPARPASIFLAPFIQELKANETWYRNLIRPGEFQAGAVRVNVKQWHTPHGLSMWRFRALETPATSVRVVYGYHWQRRLVLVLGVVKRVDSDFSYDDLHRPTSARIIQDFRAALSREP